MRTPTLPTTRIAAVLAALLVLGACATTSGRGTGDRPGRERPADTAMVVQSSGWLNGVFESREGPEAGGVAPAPGTNPAIQAKGPWLGTIGLRQLLAEHCEIGLGVAVPNPLAENLEMLPATERFRDAAVGIWLGIRF